jgi:hypothetical protein
MSPLPSSYASTPIEPGAPAVADVLIMGDRPEPFLAACLASLAPAIDRLIVNDNATSDRTNRDTVLASELPREGRVEIGTAPFDGFGPCRTRCLDALRPHAAAEQWVLHVDCDEVHHDGLRVLTRKVLPDLPSTVGVVDGWFCQFYQSPRYYLSIDRRHNLLIRFHPDVRWEGVVHERVVNLLGRRLALRYRYFHYGYVATSDHVRRRWSQYGAPGDDVSGGHALRVEQIFAADARRARRYAGSHPADVRVALAHYERAMQAGR